MHILALKGLLRFTAPRQAPVVEKHVQRRDHRQEHRGTKQIDRQVSPLVNLSRIAGDTPELKLRDLLGGFAFYGDLATATCWPRPQTKTGSPPMAACGRSKMAWKPTGSW